MTVCIGTYRGGCDVLNNEPLGGEVTVISEVTRSQHYIQLYFL